MLEYFNMITLFSTTKPLSSTDAILSLKRACASWKLLDGVSQIILFGNDFGVKEFAHEHNIEYYPDIEYSDNLPLLSAIFNKIELVTRNDIVMYTNSDIVLDGNLNKIIEAIKINSGYRDFYCTGRRWITDKKFEIITGDDKFSSLAKNAMKMNFDRPTAMDYFVFKKDFFRNIPDFRIARTCYDGWLLSEARRRNAICYDLSYSLKAFHQDHEYLNSINGKNEVYNGEIAIKNQKMLNGYQNFHTVDSIVNLVIGDKIFYNKSKQFLIFWVKWFLGYPFLKFSYFAKFSIRRIDIS
jgi:hypothetical protein